MVMASPLEPEAEIRTIPAGEFKAKCLQLMDEVKEHNLRVAITKRGKAVCHLIAAPAEEKAFRSVVGRSPNIKILGDIVSPLPQEWTLPKWAWEKPGKSHKKAKKKK
jgi:antitoxin (DNA-binding transcriptional repressor) of toxin-antitoxin stability system